MTFKGNLPPKYQFTTRQVDKGCKRKKFSLMTQNPTMSMHKHVHPKATYLLSTRSQHSKWVKDRRKRKEFSLMTQNATMTMHKHVH